MVAQFITNPEYTVYETQYTTYDPFKGLKLLGHPVAHYDNYDDMVKDWLNDFLAGTHNFFVSMKDG
jgi:hypothetical protein